MQGVPVGRFLAGRLMKEAWLFRSQCRKHRDRKADGENAITANTLDRQFTISGPNQVWCGDVTYIWAGNRWIYLAAVMERSKTGKLRIDSEGKEIEWVSLHCSRLPVNG